MLLCKFWRWIVELLVCLQLCIDIGHGLENGRIFEGGPLVGHMLARLLLFLTIEDWDLAVDFFPLDEELVCVHLVVDIPLLLLLVWWRLANDFEVWIVFLEFIDGKVNGSIEGFWLWVVVGFIKTDGYLLQMIYALSREDWRWLFGLLNLDHAVSRDSTGFCIFFEGKEQCANEILHSFLFYDYNIKEYLSI